MLHEINVRVASEATESARKIIVCLCRSYTYAKPGRIRIRTQKLLPCSQRIFTTDRLDVRKRAILLDLCPSGDKMSEYIFFIVVIIIWMVIIRHDVEIIKNFHLKVNLSMYHPTEIRITNWNNWSRVSNNLEESFFLILEFIWY